jgi:hypothetical protein
MQGSSIHCSLTGCSKIGEGPSYTPWHGEVLTQTRYNVLVLVGFCCGMLYYSMQVIWPRQSSLLFVPADDLIIRGIYANITPLATWSKPIGDSVVPLDFKLTTNSLLNLGLGNLCAICP